MYHDSHFYSQIHNLLIFLNFSEFSHPTINLVVLNFDGYTGVSSLIFIWESTWWSSTKTITHSKSGRAPPHPACVYVPGDVGQLYEAQRRWTVTLKGNVTIYQDLWSCYYFTIIKCLELLSSQTQGSYNHQLRCTVFIVFSVPHHSA